MNIIRINQFEAKPQCENELFNFMSDVVSRVQQAPGCISCKLLKGVDNSSQLVVIEEWISIAAHQQAASIIPREEIAKASSFFAKPPVGIYYQS